MNKKEASGAIMLRKKMKPGYKPNSPAPKAVPVWDCFIDGQWVCRTKAADPPEALNQSSLTDFDAEQLRAFYGSEAAPKTPVSPPLLPPDSEPEEPDSGPEVVLD